jgi:hypothetical protein
MLGNIHEILFFLKMLGKFSGNFGNFSLLGKVINVDFFLISAQKIGQCRKIPVLEIFSHFGNSYSTQ